MVVEGLTRDGAVRKIENHFFRKNIPVLPHEVIRIVEAMIALKLFTPIIPKPFEVRLSEFLRDTISHEAETQAAFLKDLIESGLKIVDANDR